MGKNDSLGADVDNEANPSINASSDISKSVAENPEADVNRSSAFGDDGGTPAVANGTANISNSWVRGIRYAAMVMFGIFVPALLTYGAHTELEGASESINNAIDSPLVKEMFETHSDKLNHANDYSLVNWAASENSNLAVILNKQMMKMVVIHIGFTAMSFAIMFIMLGFSDKPVHAKGEGFGGSIDFRFGSIGAAIFASGAIMAGVAGIMPNSYITTELYTFAYIDSSNSDIDNNE